MTTTITREPGTWTVPDDLSTMRPPMIGPRNMVGQLTNPHIDVAEEMSDPYVERTW